jgi:hypothetical protein
MVRNGIPDYLSVEEASKIGAEAYIYGCPLVLMDLTRAAMAAVSKPEGSKAPINQFLHVRQFPDYSFSDVVSPNVDTLYSTAWLDLSSGPIVLSVPKVDKRYYLMPLLDAWTNVFASPGTRTNGAEKADYAIIGPRWFAKLPEGLKPLHSPTNLVWLIGRTQTNGKTDYATVHAIQDQYKLTPLSSSGGSTPRDAPGAAPSQAPLSANNDTDLNTPPVEQLSKMEANAFFTRLNSLMKDNPPSNSDLGTLSRFSSVGIAPGRPFDLNALGPVVREGLRRGVRLAQTTLTAEASKSRGRRVNGWSIPPANTANFGTDYAWRAVAAMVGLGANLPKDAVYPHAIVDAEGEPLNGKNAYAIRFKKGELPPVNAFWSITAYNAHHFLVQNPIERYAVGDRDRLIFGADGSLTIYLQLASPGPKKDSNWLPVPSDAFNLIMRLYWPKDEILSGKWSPPAVERVHQ